MTSAIDPTKPENGIPASKADLRANLLAAKTEIEALQLHTGRLFKPMSYYGADPSVDVDSSDAFLDAFADQGVAYLGPGEYYGVQDLLVPKSAGIIGSSRDHCGVKGLNAAVPVIRTYHQYEAGSVFKDFTISGVGTRALQCIQAPTSWIQNIKIGASFPSPARTAMGGATFAVGLYLEEMFSSYVSGIFTNGCTITDACVWVACSFHSSTLLNVQTANICPVNVRFNNASTSGIGSTGFSSTGSILGNITIQGGVVGLEVRNGQSLNVSGVYSENTVLPVIIGPQNDIFSQAVFASVFSGMVLTGPGVSHPNYADRTCTILLGSVHGCKIQGAQLASYDNNVTPTLDGIHYIYPGGVEISGVAGPGLGLNKKHYAVKRLVAASSLSSFDMMSTDDAGRNVRIEQGGAHQFWERTITSGGAQVLTSWVPYFAVKPGINGARPFTQRANTTAYALDSFIYVGTAAAGSDVYRCVTAGTSGTDTAPTGTDDGQTDGTVTWDHHGVLI